MAGTTPAKKTTRRAPARKAAAAKAVPEVTGKAAPGVFDLDNLTKAEALPDLNLPTTPFQFLLAGQEYELGDPRDNDWKQAWRLSQNPFLLMRACLVGADDPVTNPTEEELELAKERLRQDNDGEEQDGEAEEQDGEAAEDKGEEPKPVPTLLDRFTAAPLPGWKLNALLENWHEHYKIDLSQGRGILDALLGRNDTGE